MFVNYLDVYFGLKMTTSYGGATVSRISTDVLLAKQVIHIYVIKK